MIDFDVQARASRFRTAAPWIKIGFGLGLILEALILPGFAGPAAAAATALFAALLSGAAVGTLLRTLAAPLGFILLGAATIPVSLAPPPDGDLWPQLAFAQSEIPRAALLAMRSFAACAAMIGVALSTPIIDVLAVLRALRVPPEIAETALLTLRFMGLLAESRRTITLSQRSRLGDVDAKRRRRSFALLCQALLVKAFDRSRRLEEGLAARGSFGEIRVLSAAKPVQAPAALLAAAGLALPPLATVLA